jgi:epsin
MDLKKVFDQTVRELKREVNKKVLKVPEIEVKILEATSNEPWGPHGTIMGDIAQATRNFNDYQMIMTVLYKRLNDTGRNWRHVYKALTVLEYLVANGAERVIDELQEHTYQIQTLCDFQYLEASGKDQGINVRKKAQTLVALIKDKDRIREVRSKAAANRDKYRGVSSTGMTHRSSSYNSTGGGYGDRDDDRDRYGGSRGGRDEYDYTGRNSGRDTDRYRDDDSYGSRDRERNRDSGYDRPRDRDASKEREAYGSSKGGSKGADEYGSRGTERYEKYESSPSSNRDRSYDDDDSFSSRNGKAKGGSTPPPAYEEAVQRAPADEDRDEGSGVAAAVARAQHSQVEAPVETAPEPLTKTNGGGSYFASQAADDDFDDFDPRGTFTATPAPAATQPSENFFSDSATPSFFPESTPAPAPAPAPAPPAAPKALGGLEDLFGDVSFGAAPAPAPAPSSSNFTNTPVQSNDLFGDSFLASQPSDAFGASAFAAPPAPAPAPVAAPADPFGGSSFTLAPPPPPPPPAYQPQAPAPPPPAYSGYGASNGNGLNGNMYGQSATPFDSGFGGQGYNNNNNNHQAHTRHQSFGDPFGAPPQVSNSLNRSASAPLPPQQPAKKEFGPVKSAIWGDTLSMGLVDLNIAGPKVNPLNDLGIQLTDPTLKNELWGADNPKQQQKKTTSSPGMGMGASMGKAMGSGSGLGRAGASALPPPMPSMRPPMGPGMGMGMGPQMGMNFNMGMGMNPGMGVSPGMGMGMGMGMGPQMGMGMNQMPPGYPNQQQQQYNGYR